MSGEGLLSLCKAVDFVMAVVRCKLGSTRERSISAMVRGRKDCTRAEAGFLPFVENRDESTRIGISPADSWLAGWLAG